MSDGERGTAADQSFPPKSFSRLQRCPGGGEQLQSRLGGEKAIVAAVTSAHKPHGPLSRRNIKVDSLKSGSIVSSRPEHRYSVTRC